MMKQRSILSSLTVLPLAIGLSFLVASAAAQTSGTAPAASPAKYSISPLLERYPNDSIQSEDAAQSALEDVDEARDRIEARYTVEQRACYPKFFTTACLDRAAEHRRKDLAAVRPIEVEANYYLRKAKVVARDRKLEEKATENETDATRRMEQGQQHDAAVQNKAVTDEHDAVSQEAQRQKRADDAARNRADYEMREQQRKARETQDAEQRAENVAKYNRKVQDAQARQQDVAKKKAERERERAIKAANAAKEQSEESATPGQ